MFVIDRTQLMTYMDGVLLDRNSEGIVVCPDEVACEKAMNLAESGEAIAMTTSGELFSVLLLNKETEEIEEISYYDWLENYCGKI